MTFQADRLYGRQRSIHNWPLVKPRRQCFEWPRSETENPSELEAEVRRIFALFTGHNMEEDGFFHVPGVFGTGAQMRVSAILLALVAMDGVSAATSGCALSLDEMRVRIEAMAGLPLDSIDVKTRALERSDALLTELDVCESHFYSLGGPPNTMAPSRERKIVTQYDNYRAFLRLYSAVIREGDADPTRRYLLNSLRSDQYRVPLIIGLDCEYHGEVSGCDS